MVKILKSDEAESEERQIARIKKEIEFLAVNLQVHQEKLQKIRQK